MVVSPRNPRMFYVSCLEVIYFDFIFIEKSLLNCSWITYKEKSKQNSDYKYPKIPDIHEKGKNYRNNYNS